MKNISKFTLILCFTIMSFNTIFAQPVQRVLFEVLTATNCQECGLYGNQLMKKIINENPEKVIGVAIYKTGTYKVSHLTPEMFYLSQYPIPCAAANRIYNIGMFAGHIFVEKENWDTIVSAALLQKAKVDVKLLYSIDKESRTIKAEIEAKFFEAMSGDFAFNIIITEDDLIAPQSGAEEDYHHNNVLRDMLGGAWGIEGIIPSDINAGQSFIYKTNFKLDSLWNIDKLHFIGIVQEIGYPYLSKIKVLNTGFGSEITNANDFTKLDNNLDNKFLIKPNPAKNQIMINYNNPANQISCPFVIYNLFGTKQKEILVSLNAGENNIPIDISELSNGIYFATIKSGTEIITKQFVIMR